MTDKVEKQDDGAASAANTIMGTDDPEGDAYYAQRLDLDVTGTAILSFPGIAASYNSQSCIGSGVSFPEVWAVIKDYILTGDEYYQSGGLTILTATAWQMPLDEAADVIEQYFRQHHYAVLVGGRPGPNLAAVQAAYAVGTTPGWDGEEKMAERRDRMIRVLEFYKFRLQQMGYTEAPNEYYRPDDEMVQDAIDAIRNDARDFDAQVASRSTSSASDNANTGTLDYEHGEMTLVATGSLQVNGSATPTVISEAFTRDEVASIATQIVEQHAQQGAITLTQSEAIAVKFGTEMLTQRMQFQDALNSQRFDGLKAEIMGKLDTITAKQESQDKAIDRHIGDGQLKAGNQQVIWTKRGVIITVILTIIGILVGAGVTWAVAAFVQ